MTAAVSSFVSEARLWDRLEQLALIGATRAGGVNRQALSPEDFAACRQLFAWSQAIGMQPARDAAGNVFVTLAGSCPGLAPVLSGSHLDSQPTGGKYDGVYGVVAALEACEAIRSAGVIPRRSIQVVAWMNEEGSRFAPGMMGSAVFAGARRLADVEPVHDAQGVSVGHALREAAEALSDIPSRALGGEVFGYVEAHIEQGPLLERLGKTIGVVTGIQGKRTFRVNVRGEAAHAGTSTRAERRDALMAAVAIVGALDERMRDVHDVVKFTVGRFNVEPNAPSVVPSTVTFSIDLRHPDSAVLLDLGDAIAGICNAKAGPCDVTVEELSTAMSLEFPAAMRERIRQASADLGISSMDILSTAGHDARYMHVICPSSMIFIPCHRGITHNEQESIISVDAAAGAKVLTEVLAGLASS